jgi:DNA polymerase I-like protein with 3'-5' exonuclease and polymerase domains
VPIIKTHELVQGQVLPENLQVYNGLDAMITLECFEAISALRPGPNLIYNFERALQGPALEMMLRGFRIDEIERRNGVVLLKGQIGRLTTILDRLAIEVWGKPLNPRSQQQLQKFFYTAMQLPEQWTSKRGERKLSMNRETLEKLLTYFHAQPVILCILGIRELANQLNVLETEIDTDGRLRQSYNIAGTETGRPSSSSNAFGTGTNIQNITHELRTIFIADVGWKLAEIDFEQSEARDIGWLCWVIFGDSTYLDHCESYDLHTATARLVWKDLPWGKDKAQNRQIAERPYYRHFSYRDMAKRGGHACNYLVSDFTMARHLKIDLKLASAFQKAYYSAYSAIPRLHRWVAQEIQTKGKLTTCFGRTREFFGRHSDEATLREAVAHCGQSPSADRTSLSMWRVWHKMRGIQLLHENYDSIIFQYRVEQESSILREAMELTQIPLFHNNRKFTVPVDCKVGWNWGDWDETTNPNGLKKYKGQDLRKRVEGLDRVL